MRVDGKHSIAASMEDIDALHENGNGESASNKLEVTEDDDCRSVGLIKLRIEQFSKLFKESVLSTPTMVRNLPWKILAIPKQHVNENRQQARALGFFVQCNGECETP